MQALVTHRLASPILNKARSIGLQVIYDESTIGDGNCFYRAVLECLSHQGINSFHGDHLDLRVAVVYFVLQNIDKPYVQNYAQNILHFEDEDGVSTLEQCLLNQLEDHTYANELFVKATALFLNLPILVTMETSTEESPYVINYPGESIVHFDMADYEGNFIIIGFSHATKHFQSLRFVGELPWVSRSQHSYIDFQIHPMESSCDQEQNSKCKEECMETSPKRLKCEVQNKTVSTPQVSDVTVVDESDPLVYLPILTIPVSTPQVSNVIVDKSVYIPILTIPVNDADKLRNCSTPNDIVQKANDVHPRKIPVKKVSKKKEDKGNKKSAGKKRAPLLCVARGNTLPQTHYIGAMNVLCEHCEAKKFPSEDFKCCHNGKVQLDPLQQYPGVLKRLLTDDTAEAKEFRQNIRKYNNAFAFASFGANLTPPPGNGPPCFRICGQVCHRSGSLHPPQGMLPLFGQLYIYDGTAAVDARMSNPANQGCQRSTMELIQHVIESVSPYAMAYKHMAEIEEEEIQNAQAENRTVSEVVMHMLRGTDRRRYNLPSHEEVAVIFVGENGAPPGTFQRDIVVYPRGRPLYTINPLSSNLDPMVYPIMFPHGDPGYSINMSHVAQFATAIRNTLTMSQFYNYRLSLRPHFSSLFYSRKLFNQYCCDAYVKIEGGRMDYFRNNQGKLRVETYQGLIDNLNAAVDTNGRQLGALVVLPSSFNGSPRAMQQHYQDAMAIVQKFGKPDLFLTFTCNPKWQEITENLYGGQYAYDRPDLVSRVFHMKLKELLKDINKNGILGRTIAFLHVIEFQKRGLPHVHLLIHLCAEHKLTQREEVDSMISAELPNPDTQKDLYNIVTSCMVHGPCGDDNPDCSCMVDGKCSKDYPKEFCDTTILNVEGYPKYRRRNDGITCTVKCKGKSIILDNRSVVPYCPWLSMKYNAHINLEACMSLKCVKYLYKYVYKGHDCANVQINEILNHDEIKTYLDARYVSAPEAVWRIFEYRMHEQSHAIKRLPVHLEHCQYVFFQNGQENNVSHVVEHSMLLAWFKLNSLDVHARDYLYTEIPEHYVYKDKKWVPRKRGEKNIITRMTSAKPSEGERFFLRILLLHIRGVTSYEHLKTVSGVICDTFREACLQLGLLADDVEWHNTMMDAVRYQLPGQLRQLFGVILVYCDPSDPVTLWDTFKAHMMEDFLHRGMAEGDAEQATLAGINRVLIQGGKCLALFGLPGLIDEDTADEPEAGSIVNDMNVGHTLNEAQLQLASTIISAVENSVVPNNNSGYDNLFYLDAPAGTGKTFTFNYLVSELTNRGFKVKTCAWSGIAATLLTNGSTMHKLFHLPVPILENSTCRISTTSKKADELRDTHLIIIDESSMVPTLAVDAVDKLLQDICGNNLPFGGKIVLFGGDFRQVLPVVPKGRPAQIIEVCLKNSRLWASIRKFSFTQNMRARPQEQQFSEWLLQIGNGLAPRKQNEPFTGSIQVPQCCVDNSTSIVQQIYGDGKVEEFESRVILTPTNADSLEINNLVLPLLPGTITTYYSADEILTDDDEERTAFPMEFINNQTPSGMPQHCLKLKVGSIVMLLRNLDLNKGLCNGTRLTVTRLDRNLIQCCVITGVGAGKLVFIPRVRLEPSDTGLPFTLIRRQFPLRLAYSMTINKSQGQTFEKVGIYLKKQCFSHGQLYVAFSRARSFEDIVVRVCKTNMQGEHEGNTYTTNVVYPQVLN